MSRKINIWQMAEIFESYDGLENLEDWNLFLVRLTEMVKKNKYTAAYSIIKSLGKFLDAIREELINCSPETQSILEEENDIEKQPFELKSFKSHLEKSASFVFDCKWTANVIDDIIGFISEYDETKMIENARQVGRKSPIILPHRKLKVLDTSSALPIPAQMTQSKASIDESSTRTLPQPSTVKTSNDQSWNELILHSYASRMNTDAVDNTISAPSTSKGSGNELASRPSTSKLPDKNEVEDDDNCVIWSETHAANVLLNLNSPEKLGEIPEGIPQNLNIMSAAHTSTITAANGFDPFTVQIKIYRTQDILNVDKLDWWKNVGTSMQFTMKPGDAQHQQLAELTCQVASKFKSSGQCKIDKKRRWGAKRAKY